MPDKPEGHIDAGQEGLVGRVEHRANAGAVVEALGDIAVEQVREPGPDKKPKRRAVLLVEDQPDQVSGTHKRRASVIRLGRLSSRRLDSPADRTRRRQFGGRGNLGHHRGELRRGPGYRGGCEGPVRARRHTGSP